MGSLLIRDSKNVVRVDILSACGNSKSPTPKTSWINNNKRQFHHS